MNVFYVFGYGCFCKKINVLSTNLINSILFCYIPNTNLFLNFATKMRTEKKNKKIFKKLLYAIMLMVILLVAWQWELVYYGISQARGQVRVLWNAKPVEEIINDPSYPDSLKVKIKLVQEIRAYAFDSLGLTRSENYTTMYDQQGKPLLWVVTGSEPFQLKEKEWSFPILGTFSYKGFFVYEKAQKEENELKKSGLDASIDEVEGWSTLGWFKDPILSNMLKRTPGSLANLIIHELTHGTLYVKDRVQYNENLASFVGHMGALRFLKYKYGEDSDEYRDYIKRSEIRKGFSKQVLHSADRLDSLYGTFIPKMPFKEKQNRKRQFMNSLITEFKDSLAYLKNRDRKFFSELDKINNTFFIGFRMYKEDQSIFEEELAGKFKGDFKAYFDYLKKKYPSL